MKVDFIQEPELEFGSNGRHIDIRFGLMNYGPLDRGLATAPEQIRIGIVGSSESVEGFIGWIAACRDGIAAKESKQPNLFPPFPGFGADMMLHADLVTIAQEVLALTKMNWNNTQFDNSEPIIVTAARKVGKILKYMDADAKPQTRYSFYM